MVWNSASDFFHMGGYALYVWGSVIVTFGLMLAELLILRIRRNAICAYLGSARDIDEGAVVETSGSDRENEGQV